MYLTKGRHVITFRRIPIENKRKTAIAYELPTRLRNYPLTIRVQEYAAAKFRKLSLVEY